MGVRNGWTILWWGEGECAKCGSIKVTKKGNGRKEAYSNPPLLDQ